MRRGEGLYEEGWEGLYEEGWEGLYEEGWEGLYEEGGREGRELTLLDGSAQGPGLHRAGSHLPWDRGHQALRVCLWWGPV